MVEISPVAGFVVVEISLMAGVLVVEISLVLAGVTVGKGNVAPPPLG